MGFACLVNRQKQLVKVILLEDRILIARERPLHFGGVDPQQNGGYPGVQTGSLIAAVLGLKPGRAIAMVLLGNVVAGTIMLLLSGFFFPGAVF